PARTNVQSQRHDQNSLWNTLRHMLMIRKKHHAFSRGEFEWLDLENDRTAGFQRISEDETILAMYNLSDSEQRIVLKTKGPVKSLTDLLSQKVFTSTNESMELDLAPYQFLWLK
ncbi:MAG: alpha-glucosidase C-terminal domain-containing protein, partial [Anaerolineales bacterium]